MNTGFRFATCRRGHAGPWYFRTTKAGASERYCKPCRRLNVNIWWQTHRTDPHTKKKKSELKSRYESKIISDVFGHYGGRCWCCGESRPKFLTIDHIKGNGSAHRREIGVGGGKSFYRWLRQNGFPDGFRTLCFNCNCGRQRNLGVCPHDEERDAAGVCCPDYGGEIARISG